MLLVQHPSKEIIPFLTDTSCLHGQRGKTDRAKLHEVPFLSYVPIFNPGTRSMKIS